jgi:hypothetical protein
VEKSGPRPRANSREELRAIASCSKRSQHWAKSSLPKGSQNMQLPYKTEPGRSALRVSYCEPRPVNIFLFKNRLNSVESRQCCCCCCCCRQRRQQKKAALNPSRCEDRLLLQGRLLPRPEDEAGRGNNPCVASFHCERFGSIRHGKCVAIRIVVTVENAKEKARAARRSSIDVLSSCCKQQPCK